MCWMVAVCLFGTSQCVKWNICPSGILLRWEDQLAFLNAAAWRRKAVKQHLICDFLMLVGEGRLAELKSLLLSLSTVIFPPCWFFSLQAAATTVTIWGRVDDQLELLVLAGQYWNEEANAVVGVSGWRKCCCCWRGWPVLVAG